MLGAIQGIKKLKWQLQFLETEYPEAVKAALMGVEKSIIDDVFLADTATLVEFLDNVDGELPYRTDPFTHSISEQIRVLSNSLKNEVTSDGGFQKIAEAWFGNDGVAGVRLFDMAEARKVATSIAGSGAIAERLAESGPWRRTGFDDGILNRLELLKGKTPNFSEVIDCIMDAVTLAVRYNRPIRITPIVMVGEAGIGKSFFTDQLSQVMGVPLTRIAVDNLQIASDLAGMSFAYAKSSPGAVFRVLTEESHISPLVILDELDKVPLNWGYGDPLGPLHNLLEPVSAKVFKDGSFPVPIEASHVIWIATANSLAPIPSTILSRFEVYKVGKPSTDQFDTILSEICRELENQYPGVSIKDEVNKVLHGKTPREQRQLLQRAIARAIRLGDDCVSDWHVNEVMGHGKPRRRLRVVRGSGYLLIIDNLNS